MLPVSFTRRPPHHEGLKLRRDGFTSGLVDQSPGGGGDAFSEARRRGWG
jgi:hypothetical protein